MTKSDTLSRYSIKNIFIPRHGMCSLCYIVIHVGKSLERQRLWS